MTTKTKWARFGIGAVTVIIILVITLGFIDQWIPTWGSTPEEQQAVYPGDELSPKPLVNWTHGYTYRYPVDIVWPWLAQLGDQYGAFYSYTFIENMIGDVRYVNANRIIPEFQDPQPGSMVVSPLLAWKEIKTGEYLLAADVIDDMTWTWMFSIKPEGDSTRMIVRMRIQLPDGVAGSEPIRFIMNVGGFIMEKGFIYGLRDRLNGVQEPAWIEIVEIAIWLIALICGIIAAICFINRKDYRLPIVLGLVSIFVLVYFTFGQPAVWIRAVMDLALVILTVYMLRRKQ